VLHAASLALCVKVAYGWIADFGSERSVLKGRQRNGCFKRQHPPVQEVSRYGSECGAMIRVHGLTVGKLLNIRNGWEADVEIAVSRLSELPGYSAEDFSCQIPDEFLRPFTLS
jgi:hypothetical protein